MDALLRRGAGGRRIVLMVSCLKERSTRGGKSMRRNIAILVLFTIAAFCSGCSSSDTSGNGGRTDVETTVNSERIDSSNIAPTGGPGPEPESSGAQPSGNANKSKSENKNKNTQ